jgi:hypothetical protein
VTMRATLMHMAHKVRVESVPDAAIQNPTALRPDANRDGPPRGSRES